ncbi:MAG: helix-turn-helix transcriptional regulator [Myxococcota bacterium]
MRYDGAVEVLRLILELQASAEGLCLDQIQELFEVSRKTAERRLQAARRVFPEIESHDPGDGRKHWRLSPRRGPELVRPDPTELAALEAATEFLDRDGRPDQAEALRRLGPKVRAVLRPEARARVETDVEALLEGEGLAMRPGPRPRIKPDIVEVLRRGLLECHCVRIRYHSRIRDCESERDVHPCGFLLGGRHYLVAHDGASDTLRLFSLARVQGATLLDRYFERPEGFDLRKFATRSFGVFQEEPRSVVWRFAPAAARDAREHVFHPSQQLEEQPDGSLIVRFRAGGLWEMAWHLFRWGDQVEILEPPELRDQLVTMLRRSLGRHAEA